MWYMRITRVNSVDTRLIDMPSLSGQDKKKAAMPDSLKG